MTKEFIGIVTTIVLLLGLLGSVSTGVWWVSKLENRLSVLESDRAWKAKVDSIQKVNTQRWQRHFQLWGDAIERQTRELHNRSAPPPPEIGGVGE